METVQEETKGMLTISNFFTPLVTQAANNNKHQSKSVVEKPQQQQQQESSEKHQKQEPSPKKKAPKMDFFAPRRSNPKPVVLTRDDNDDVSTVVASPMDDKSAVVTTPRSHPKSSHAYESAKKLEREELQEDPILEDDKDDDLTAPSSTSRFVGKKRLFKNTYSKRTPKSKATMALELADARSPKRSPLAFAASTPKSPKRSPLTLAPEQQQSTWRGLRNLGNTCYLNSAMQMIFSVPDFLQALTTATVDNEKQHHLSSGILQLWQNLNDPQRTGAATPFKIKKAIDERTDKFRGYQQRDAHEFLGDLIDQIHEELEKPPQGEEKKEDDETKKLLLPTDEFFRLNVEVCLECKSCGYSRYVTVLKEPPSSRYFVRRNLTTDASFVCVCVCVCACVERKKKCTDICPLTLRMIRNKVQITSALSESVWITFSGPKNANSSVRNAKKVRSRRKLCGSCPGPRRYCFT